MSDTAVEYLRAHCDALLAIGEGEHPRLDRVRYVIDPASGNIVIAARKELDSQPHLVLHVPEDCEGGLHILVEARVLGDCAAVDRFLICLGPPRDKASGTFYELTPVWAKQSGVVYSAEQVAIASPWAGLQGKLCATVNSDPRMLSELAREAGLSGEHAGGVKLVGVDPWGIDLRAPFGLARGSAQAARDLYAKVIAPHNIT
jgi:hypothetical protein